MSSPSRVLSTWIEQQREVLNEVWLGSPTRQYNNVYGQGPAGSRKLSPLEEQSIEKYFQHYPEEQSKGQSMARI